MTVLHTLDGCAWRWKRLSHHASCCLALASTDSRCFSDLAAFCLKQCATGNHCTVKAPQSCIVCSLIPKPIARNSSDFSSTLPAGSEQCTTWASCHLDRLVLLATLLSVTAHIQVSLFVAHIVAKSGVSQIRFLQVL